MVALTDKIAVLYGGDSAEREVSLNSGRAVAKGLKQAGYQDVELIDTKGFELNQLNVMKVKHVFIALHGKGGEDGTLQGALEYLNIPYTGSGVLGSALAMDKVKCKQIWQSLGYGTADFIVVRKANFNAHECDDMIARLGGKVMVKPATEGSSIGMSIANSGKELQQALENAFDYDEQILVEAWINGLEYTVAILGDKALPAIRMETANEFYDYQAKYQSTTTQYHCPCGLSENDESALQTLALNAFNAVGVSVWGRVDVMRNEQGEWLLLEVNTVPGMTETSLVPKAAKVAGYSFSDLVHNVLTLSA